MTERPQGSDVIHKRWAPSDDSPVPSDRRPASIPGCKYDEVLERLREAEWDVSTLRTERDAAILSATMDLRALVRRAQGLVGYACDVPQRGLEAQQWLDDARAALDQEAS
jgi:hypothetical protein